MVSTEAVQHFSSLSHLPCLPSYQAQVSGTQQLFCKGFHQPPNSAALFCMVRLRESMETALVDGIPTYPSEKYEFVSWDDEITNRWR